MKKAVFSLRGSYSSLNEEEKNNDHLEEKNPDGDTEEVTQTTKLLGNKGEESSPPGNGEVSISVRRSSSGSSEDNTKPSVPLDAEGKIRYEVKDLFCELLQLQWIKGTDEQEWVERSRWVKFEEAVEMGGRRWSKPRVATLCYHHIKQMQNYLHDGHVILDLDGTNVFEITDMLIYRLMRAQIHGLNTEKLRDVLLRKHHHQHEKKSRLRSSSYNLLHRKDRQNGLRQNSHEGQHDGMHRSDSLGDELEDTHDHTHDHDDVEFIRGEFKPNLSFMRKVPPGAEACNILVGAVDQTVTQGPLFVFSRLTRAASLGDFTEVPVKTRFLCIFLVPEKGNSIDFHEIGRAIGTLMADEIFREIAYKAEAKYDLLTGINEFLDNVTCMPPSEWDPKIRVDPPASTAPQLKRRKTMQQITGRQATEFEPQDESEDQAMEFADPTLVRTGRLFGGVIRDIRRRYRFYVSDFRDAIHIQCVASFLFLFFAVLTSNVTFGGVLGKSTDYNMANMENILGGAICGVTYSLFAGQPLTLLGSTGPMLVFEVVAYRFCKSVEIDYLPFRVWIGLWTSLILLLMVVFDLSSLVRYITKFTEESFALLISLIFMYQAINNLISISATHPVRRNSDIPLTYDCLCTPSNATNQSIPVLANSSLFENCTQTLPYPDCIDWNSISRENCTKAFGTLTGDGCDTPEYDPDVFFLSVLLFVGTFTIAMALKALKASRFFPTKIRQTISDFAVPIAMASMIGVDLYYSIETPKLTVPDKFQPTSPNRGWIIHPLGSNPWWTTLAASLPALLATILIFMDQQITSVIVNRRQNKLKKGHGYHLDLLVVAVQIAVCSVMGLPWFVAATVESMTHVNSLKVDSESTAPGEKPNFIGVREQRITGAIIYVLVGCAVLLGPFLKYVPMPVLYGVFLYLGVSALQGKEVVQRILILFMPHKYQPDYMFLRHVKTRRVHLFTLCQVVCLALLWIVKQVKAISIAFPLMVLAMCIVRKGMEKIFNQHELFWLDDLFPDTSSKTQKKPVNNNMSLDSKEIVVNSNGKSELGVDSVSMV